MTFLKKFLQQRQAKFLLAPLTACVVAVLIIATAFSSSRLQAHTIVSLSAEQVGVGMGVPACESSAGPTCDESGNVVYTATWDETANEGNSPSCDSNGDASVTVFINRTSDNARVATASLMPCAGSYTFDFPPSANTSYNLFISGTQSNSYYDGTPIATFAAPTTCNASTPPPAPAPTGQLTQASGCTTSGTGGTCTAPAAWTTQNSSFGGSPFSGINIINNSTGTFYGGSPVAGVSYYTTSNANGSYGFNLPQGTYTFQLYGYQAGNTTAVALDYRTVVVTNPLPPSGSCPVGYVGTPPNCTIASPMCPPSYTGTPSNCTYNPGGGCPTGWSGTYPSCVQTGCPIGWTGTYPSCTNPGNVCSSVYSGVICPLPQSCLPGDTGTFPNCIPPAGLTLSASPTRVRYGSFTNLTWSATGVTSCVLSGQNGFTNTNTSGSAVPSNTDSGNPITSQTTFTLTCQTASGYQTKTAVVNLVPTEVEI